MSKLQTALFYYSFLLSVVLLSAGVPALFVVLPVTCHFLFSILSKLHLINKSRIPLGNFISSLFVYYGFIITAIMTITGFLGARNSPQLVSAAVFLPITLYFIIKVAPKRNKAMLIPRPVVFPKEKAADEIFEDLPAKPKRLDLNRRQFLKLIGSAGITLFLFSIFSKKAHASFFGSVPGPGIVSIKDSSGVQIDPALKQPTDGYRISQIDDSTPAYYGFVDKNSNWFIMQENSTNGNYRYTKGASSFSTNWTNRASLTYDYFDAVF